MKLTLKASLLGVLITSVCATSQAQEDSSSMIPVKPANTQKLTTPPPPSANPTGQPDNMVLRGMREGGQILVDEFGRQVPANVVPQYVPTQAPTMPTRTSFAEKVEDSWKPVQTITLAPGDNKMIAIGAGQMNTVRTNFKKVSAITTIAEEDEDLILLLEEGFVYITANNYDPITLNLFEEGVLDSQITLVLQPIAKPPTRVNLDVTLSDEQLAKGQEFRIKQAQEEAMLEGENEPQRQVSAYNYHEQSILDVLTPIARGKVPNRYTLSSEVPSYHQMPCRMAISHGVVKRIVGTRDLVDVVHITNNLDRPYRVAEQMCLADDVIAVGVLQQATLQPGEKTIFLIMRDKLYQNDRERDISDIMMIGS